MSRKVDVDEAVKISDKFNRISIADFEIESSRESMDKLVSIMKDLIAKYSGFVGERSRAIVSKSNGGYYG
jgi:hypothetical protein